MDNISFQINFDKNVDNKKEFITVESFWDFFFTRNLTATLLHQVKFSENWVKNLIDESDEQSQKRFDECRYDEFKETAKNTTEEIYNSIKFDLIKEDDNIQTFDVSFDIDYKISSQCKYCSSIQDYFNDAIIDSITRQTEILLETLHNRENDRGIRLHSHFIELLNDMKESLKIVEAPKKRSALLKK